jgi:hypothetical protein
MVAAVAGCGTMFQHQRFGYMPCNVAFVKPPSRPLSSAAQRPGKELTWPFRL